MGTGALTPSPSGPGNIPDEEKDRSTTRIVRSGLGVKDWIAEMPSVDRVRPVCCPCCGRASRPTGACLRLHGHGLRMRQTIGPVDPLGPPVTMDVLCRRYLCVACGAVVLVVPGAMLRGRRYSGPAIAQALALFGLEGLSPAKVRGRTSPDKIVGATASTGWVTLYRWSDAARDGQLFPGTRACPTEFTRRQVAERAASTVGGRAPPPVEASLVVRAFIGATLAA